MPNVSEESTREVVAPGWYVEIIGDDFDVFDWEAALKPPFDPAVFKLSDGMAVLRSAEFTDLGDASEVRERAKPMIARLNGALALHAHALPLRFGRVVQIDSLGRRHMTVFGEVGLVLGRCRATGHGVTLDRDGNPVPPPPPEPSKPQTWIAAAMTHDEVADLLDHLGRADNWYDIYKTIELAERLVGGEAKLLKLLGTEAAAFKNMRSTANFYRHARAHRPSKLTNLHDAKSMLAYGTRMAMEKIGL